MIYSGVVRTLLLLDLIDSCFRSKRNTYLLLLQHQSVQVHHQDLLVDTMLQ